MFLRFLKAVFAGLTAAILFPLIQVVDLILLFPYLFLKSFKNIVRYTREFRRTRLILRFMFNVVSELIKLFVFLALSALYCLFIAYYAYPVFLIINVGIGLFVAWQGGLDAVFNHCINQYHKLVLLFQNVLNFNLQRSDHYLIPKIIGNSPGIEITTLSLTDVELTTLRSNQRLPLNDEEKARLKSATDRDIKRIFTQYNDLKTQIEPRECSITGESLTKENAVLLVKIYLRGEQWMPVPNASFIYDKEALIGWLANNDTHPTTREKISSPSRYENCATRFVQYPCYANEDLTSGVSQELSDMIGILRTYLERHPKRVGTTAPGIDVPPQVVYPADDCTIRRNTVRQAWCRKFPATKPHTPQEANNDELLSRAGML